MKRNQIEALVCVIFMIILLVSAHQVDKMNKVHADTLENINTGYRPDIARHIALVDNHVIQPDSLYIALMED